MIFLSCLTCFIFNKAFESQLDSWMVSGCLQQMDSQGRNQFEFNGVQLKLFSSFDGWELPLSMGSAIMGQCSREDQKVWVALDENTYIQLKMT